MAKLSKRFKAIRENVDLLSVYPITDAIKHVKDCSKVKFDESVDVSVVLGIDARKSDQGVRGSTVLPHGTGRDVKVAVFAQGANADKAKAAGADIVGYDDLAADIKDGKMDFDIVIATPDAMAVVGKLGQILGPRGLMPNPKVGTVTADVETAVKNAKAGQIQFRNDKGGIIHCPIGKVSFEPNQLNENLDSLIVALKKAKPASAKGIYLKKIIISSTMGPGLKVDLATIDVK